MWWRSPIATRAIDAAADVERGDPGAAQDRRAGAGRALGERPIEAAAIDDGRGDVAAVDADAAAVPAVEGRRAGDGGDGFAGKIELSECVETEHAGAVHRVADLAVLFENENRQPLRSEEPGGAEPGGACPNNQDIPFAGR